MTQLEHRKLARHDCGDCQWHWSRALDRGTCLICGLRRALSLGVLERQDWPEVRARGRELERRLAEVEATHEPGEEAARREHALVRARHRFEHLAVGRGRAAVDSADQ
eukprot:CAMPEP_0196731170 /NCGR_PEP_ID=MMETSP1091-20130531/11011_1 /TAXON_ID=302021 /ORGANISM="Rhodomonas sp., Strain CCMP768" /LENGTH=107 /DNA_ID=CAMNT_0042074285 /DNA_START=208 /DNA_END=531 /DNA_ORIENTATION=+